MTYPQHPAVFTDSHAHYICRCGEPVMLSINGVDVRECACTRRHHWTGDAIKIVRPKRDREQ